MTGSLITMIRSKLIRSLMRPGKRTSSFARSALLACIAMTAVGGLSADAGTLKELLAPTGSLRMAIAIPKGREQGRPFVGSFVLGCKPADSWSGFSRKPD
jgi:hypothetical protein